MADNPRSGRSRRRRLNGEGTISGPRKDGRYVAAFYTRTSAGMIKRVYVYGKTWAQARDRLVEEQSKAIRGIPTGAESWKLAAYLDYWLENIVKPHRRAATYALYESVIRLYLKPDLGHYWLRRLSVPIVQSFLNVKLAEGKSIRNVHIMREVLSAALTRAVREERVSRNVARLIELPGRESRDIRPWSADEAIEFLRAAKPDPLYPAFVLLILYGMRRGEVLGLRWQDVDLDAGTFAVRQQLQRIHGSLRTGPVKTRAGNRELPIPGLAREALLIRQQQQAADRQAFGRAWQDTGLVFTTRSGLPIEPRNLARSFRRICDRNNIRVIKVHHLRHSTASLLKKLRVAPRDAQMILGHAHISTTMQIYTHVDQESRDDALASLNKLLGGGQ
jgi:integrase